MKVVISFDFPGELEEVIDPDIISEELLELVKAHITLAKDDVVSDIKEDDEDWAVEVASSFNQVIGSLESRVWRTRTDQIMGKLDPT